MTVSTKQEWSTHTGFILAAIGSAVGLGNVWKFAYVAGEGGGGAFILIYLASVFLVVVPVLVAELMVGRHGHKDPVDAARAVRKEAGAGPVWETIGWLGIIAPFIILSFYCVVAGWTLDYLVMTASGQFRGLDSAGVSAVFGSVLQDPGRLIMWQTVVLAITAVIVMGGIQNGIERAVTFLMPPLFLILIALVIYGVSLGGFGEAVAFMFVPDFSQVDGEVLVRALGQAFFSLSVGAGMMLAYASYLPNSVSIPRAALTIGVADTAVAIVAGLAIFPIVFSYGLSPAEGPELVFVSLPNAFANLPFGTVFGCAFFLLLAFAAVTSSISMLEPPVSFVLQRSRLNRRQAVVLVSAMAWVFGCLALLSFNLLADVRPLGLLPGFEDKSIFDSMDHLTSNLMMPISGILLTLFTGWVINAKIRNGEFGGAGLGLRVWLFLARFVAPAAIFVILVNGFILPVFHG